MQIKDTIALSKLAYRLNNPVKQIDNGRLHAGSPMYFYCKMCGYQSDVKPESYTTSPKKHCGSCKQLMDSNPDITSDSLVDMAKSIISEANQISGKNKRSKKS